jgi:twitching motility protein PilT
MSDLLQLVLDEGASDLHLPVGSPPVLRIHGEMTPLDTEPLNPEDTEYCMKSITSEANQQKIQEDGTADFGFAFGEKARFRVSAFRQKGNIGMVLRTISNDVLTLEQIGLPSAVKDILFRPRGLVLVTGPTGSGKSTTLASMIDVINQEKTDHIITIEDPIEFYHNHRHSVITQREVGVDVPSFGDALRRALRQDPDVILVGEMRDLETIGAAITAAETGHLVFGTLHTTGAAETVDRVVDAFPTDQQEQVRTQLAASLICVISQVLLKRADKAGRVAAFEIMISTPSIQALIRDGKTYRITSDIQTGAKYGMNTLDSHLLALYKEGKISYGDLITKCKDAEGMVQKMKQDRERK